MVAVPAVFASAKMGMMPKFEMGESHEIMLSAKLTLVPSSFVIY